MSSSSAGSPLTLHPFCLGSGFARNTPPQMRVKTCTRNAEVRLFLVGVALVLRNVWVWLHHEALATPRRGRRRYRLERLRFKDRLLMLHREAERLLGVDDDVWIERPLPKGVVPIAQKGLG